MKAEELKDIVEKGLLEIGNNEITVEVEMSIPEVAPGEGQYFHIKLAGDIFLDDLHTVAEAVGDKNIIIDGHPEGGLDVFCCIKNKE